MEAYDYIKDDLIDHGVGDGDQFWEHWDGYLFHPEILEKTNHCPESGHWFSYRGGKQGNYCCTLERIF